MRERRRWKREWCGGVELGMGSAVVVAGLEAVAVAVGEGGVLGCKAGAGCVLRDGEWLFDIQRDCIWVILVGVVSAVCDCCVVIGVKYC